MLTLENTANKSVNDAKVTMTNIGKKKSETVIYIRARDRQRDLVSLKQHQTRERRKK